MKRLITSQFMHWKDAPHRKPMVLRGARQVGKTHAIREFGSTCFSKVHYLNFEEDERLADVFALDLDPKRILSEIGLRLKTSIDESVDILIFDEIQRCPKALTSLKYFCEEKPHLAVCAAGSLLGITLTSDSFPVGKVSFIDLYPMNFMEFLEALGEQDLLTLLERRQFKAGLPVSAHERLWQIWKAYMVVGGLPEAVVAYVERRDRLYEAMTAARNVQLDLVSSYLADMAKHAGGRNAMHVERLWRNVPAQIVRTQDGSVPKFRFRDAVPGLRGYERLVGPLDWLERANLVRRISIVDTAEIPLAAHIDENRFKLLFFDIGMLGAVGGMDPEIFMGYGFGTYKGFMAESFVAQELIAAGLGPLYSWQGRTSEIEFLLQSAHGIMPLEVKSGNSVYSRSLSVFEERYEPLRSFILSGRNEGLRSNRWSLPIYLAGILPINE